jgi:YHS domain-containing protein
MLKILIFLVFAVTVFVSVSRASVDNESLLSCNGGQACGQAAIMQEAGQGLSSKAVAVGNKRCPVMGAEIPEGSNITYEYKGRIYSFCCAGCPDVFKSDPEKYSKIADDEVAAAQGLGN